MEYLITYDNNWFELFKISKRFGRYKLYFKRIDLDKNGKISSDKFKEVSPSDLCRNNNHCKDGEVEKIRHIFDIMSSLNPKVWTNTFEYWNAGDGFDGYN